jgi:hypothetical protein
MKTPFILSASSRDQVLKGISTMRIPEYGGESPSGGATDKLGTGSTEGDKFSGRSSPPSGDGSQGDEDEPDPGMGLASFGSGGGASNVDYGGGSAAAKQAKKQGGPLRAPQVEDEEEKTTPCGRG